jgi:hypothetical protein
MDSKLQWLLRHENAMSAHHGWPSALGMGEAPIRRGYCVRMRMTPTEIAFASCAFGAVCTKLLDLASHIKKQKDSNPWPLV